MLKSLSKYGVYIIGVVFLMINLFLYVQKDFYLLNLLPLALLVAFAANQVLEELVFPGGFVTLWSLGHKMIGTAKDISFIERDRHSI